MLEFFKELNIDLIDFKIEFGKTLMTARSFSLTRFLPTPAASGTAQPTRSSTRTVSVSDMGGVEDAYQLK